MIKLDSPTAKILSDKTAPVLVVGCTRRSGLTTANFLASRGFSVTANDLKSIDKLEGVADGLDKRVRREFGHQSESLLDSAGVIVLSPGVPRTIPLLKAADARAIPVIAEVELAWHFTKGYILGITGTDGKSTTTAMCAYVLRRLGIDAREGGNIGIPLISLAESSNDDTVTVAELSSFQLETIADFNCDCAAFLNLAPDHLDRYPSMKEYLEAKRRIFMNQCVDDFCIINGDDKAVCDAVRSHRAKIRRFSLLDTSADLFFREGTVYLRRGGEELPLLAQSRMTLRGLHNVQNAMAAILLILSLFEKRGRSCDLAALAEACASYAGLPHRLQMAGEAGGLRFINDSKATTVNAVMTALKSMSDDSVFIVGGRAKGEDYSVMAKAFAQNPLVKGVVLIGETSDDFEKIFAEEKIPLVRASDMDDAVDKGRDLCARGTVILSPGCASFDMFENYERRGDAFMKSAARLAGAR